MRGGRGGFGRGGGGSSRGYLFIDFALWSKWRFEITEIP